MLAVDNNTMWDGECGSHHTKACDGLRAKCLGTHPQEASMTPLLHAVHGDLLPEGGQAPPAVEKPGQHHFRQGSNMGTEKSRREHALIIERDRMAFVSVVLFLVTHHPSSWMRKTSLKPPLGLSIKHLTRTPQNCQTIRKAGKLASPRPAGGDMMTERPVLPWAGPAMGKTHIRRY